MVVGAGSLCSRYLMRLIFESVPQREKVEPLEIWSWRLFDEFDIITAVISHFLQQIGYGSHFPYEK